MPDLDAIIVGAGLAGLSCGRRLVEIGRSFTIIDASDAVGGRVRTDVMDGFRLDRGFQVLATAFPEASRALNYRALDLRPFPHGVLIRHAGRFHRLVDPRYHWRDGVKTFFGPIGTIADKWRLLQLHARLARDRKNPFDRPEGLTLDYLRWAGRFSEEMIDRFFRPLGGWLFLDRDLVTSSRSFRFMFRMIGAGDIAVPARGMAAIPQQMADGLPAGSVRLKTTVDRVEPGRVILQTGEELTARAVVVATDGPDAARLLVFKQPPLMRSVCCLYFSADESPLNEPILVLDSEGRGPVNHFAVMSDVAPEYAPAGAALISASVLGDPPQDDGQLESDVRNHLAEWFGPSVHGWRHLRMYRLRHAVPDQTAPALDVPERPVRIRPGLYVCGDHRDNATIDGAMHSGWRAAQAAAEDIHEGLV